MRDAIALIGLLDNANAAAFIAVIRTGEGTADEDGFRRHFGGELFDNFADHPRKAVTKMLGGKPLTSTAAGAGQFLARTWDECAAALGLRDFSPKNQLLAILWLIDRRKALDDVVAGRFEQAVIKCNREWASLPGSPYGQPVKTMAQAKKTYFENGGLTSPQDGAVLAAWHEPAPVQTSPQPQTEAPMPLPLLPIIAAVLPNLIGAIPQLGKLFGSGSEISERNVKAAEIAVGIVQEAVGARNAQEAVEMVQSDPAMAQAAIKAVEARWFELVEVGGGVEAARKADAERTFAGDFLQSPSFWVAVLLLPLVYMLVASLIGLLGTASWSDDVRAGLSGSIISAIIGGLVGYYYGQTTTRNRAPA